MGEVVYLPASIDTVVNEYPALQIIVLGFGSEYQFL